MKKFMKMALLVLSLSLVVGCHTNQTYDIYNTWVCNNKKGPIFVIQKDGPYYQYNKQSQTNINYFIGSKAVIKNGKDAVDVAHQLHSELTFKDIEHLYSIQLYFETYIDENGADSSHLIAQDEVWWYMFQLVGNGRAEVLNMNTGETFYVEVK